MLDDEIALNECYRLINLDEFVDSLPTCNIQWDAGVLLKQHAINAAKYNDCSVHKQLVPDSTTTDVEFSTSVSGVQNPLAGQTLSFKHRAFKKESKRKDRRGRLKFVRRNVTNSTYLRRLYLTRAQAQCMLSDLKLTQMALSRKLRALQPQKTEFDVTLVTKDEKSWNTVFECAVSANGQLHCRLVDGWSKFCRDNDVALHDCVVFEPSIGNANEIFVRIERTNQHV
jgi:B3 DNA binding domain